MNLNLKIKGSSIQYAIITVLLIAFLLGGLLLYAGATSKLQVRFDLQDRMIDNVNSALEYGKSISEELEYDKTVVLNLFETENDRIELTKKNWGIYNYLIAEANHPKFNFKSVMMIGNYHAKEAYCLYLADRGSGLAVCGKTVIRGRALLPKKGVKRAYIAGQNFVGEKLIDGKIEKSRKELPELNSRYLNQIQKPLFLEKLDWLTFDSLQHSFSESPKFFYSNSSISIENTFISGHIIIESTDSIYVSNTAHLEDVIIKAPVIYIEKGFVGSAQFITSHKIIVSENVLLKYPSVLALFENVEFEKPSSIILKEDAIILGSILLHSSTKNFRKEVFLDVNENAEIHGLAYCQGITQLKGVLNGSLITNKFYLKTQSSAYENHLLNAVIKNELPNQFCVVPLLTNNYKTTDIKCLN